MPRRLPILAVILGVAGIIPFILCGLGAVSASFIGAQVSAQLLLAYGAVVLSFLGGIHWGQTLGGQTLGGQTLAGQTLAGQTLAGDESVSRGVGVGILPGLLGWLSLALSSYVGRPSLGLVLMIALFILAAAAEWRGQLLGGIPAGYIVLRIMVTVAIVAILTTVLVLRLVGGHLLM